MKKVSVTNAEGPPVPIPNTEVKLCSGEDTLRETVRENSSVLTLTEGRAERSAFPEGQKRRKKQALKQFRISRSEFRVHLGV